MQISTPLPSQTNWEPLIGYFVKWYFISNNKYICEYFLLICYLIYHYEFKQLEQYSKKNGASNTLYMQSETRIHSLKS